MKSIIEFILYTRVSVSHLVGRRRRMIPPCTFGVSHEGKVYTGGAAEYSARIGEHESRGLCSTTTFLVKLCQHLLVLCHRPERYYLHTQNTNIIGGELVSAPRKPLIQTSRTVCMYYHACMYTCVHLYMHVCKYVCKYVCVYKWSLSKLKHKACPLCSKYGLPGSTKAADTLPRTMRSCQTQKALRPAYLPQRLMVAVGIRGLCGLPSLLYLLIFS
jgi:hypothetical protein